MRVRFITSLRRGGPIEHTVSLARELVRDGIDVGVVCATDQVSERFRAAGADAVEVPLGGWADALRMGRVRRFVRGADVLHAQDRRAGLWVRLGPRPRPGGVRVYTVHGLPDEYLPLPNRPTRPGLRAFLAYRGVDAALCRRADAVVVPSSAFVELLVARLGFPREKLVVIPHGVEVPETPLAEGSLVGTVTLLEPVKGLDVFLRAAARLSRVRPELRFVVFGIGSEADELESLAAGLGIGDRVEFPGYVPKNEALSRLAIFVMSSYLENAPLALLEAMAAGVPVVATRVGGVPELAGAGTVELVAPGDDRELAASIERLLDDPGLRENRVAAARERVLTDYSPAACAGAMLTLYRRLLGAA